MSLHTNQQEQQNFLVVDNNHDSEGDAVMSESKDNQHDQLHEKNNLINDQSLDDVANSINNNNNLIITIPDDDNNSSKTNNVNLLLNSEGIDHEEDNNNLIISEGNNNDIMIFDDWSKEEDIASPSPNQFHIF